MKAIDLPLAIEALGYSKECIEINKHREIYFNIMRKTFLRKTRKDQEGVGSIFEGIECAPIIPVWKKTPDEDIVYNLTEFLMTSKKINVERDLYIEPYTNFPGYVKVLLRFIPLSNKSSFAINYEKNILREDTPALLKYTDYRDHRPNKEYVCCIAFKSWPVEANKWVSRNKPNNWPSKGLIEKIKSKGFNLAPFGHNDCRENDYQWRIGIRGEKELLSNLNETQILCYVALRLILKDDIQLINKDVLSSYHMKNVVFWCAEQESCQWTTENFEICLQTCIDRLITFIRNRTFPHYIIEDRNLINSKMTPYLTIKILESLTKYRSNVLSILSLRPFDWLKKITLDFRVLLLNCVKQRSITQNYIMLSFQSLGIFYVEQHLLWETYEGHDTASNLQNAQHILDILENTKRLFISPYIAYAKSMLGLLYYSRFNETHEFKNLKVRWLLKSSVTFKHVAIQFRFATFSFMTNEFYECLDVCNAFLNSPKKYKTSQEKRWLQNKLFSDIRNLLNLLGDIANGVSNPSDLTKLKEEICEIFYDRCISEESGDGRLKEAKTLLSDIRTMSGKSNVVEILLDIIKKYKSSCNIVSMILQNLPNLLFCDMSFNVPYLAAEKWAVPDVIQYELLSVWRCHPESSIYGIYIDPMLNCLVLSFLCYTKTGNLTKMNEILTEMAEYIEEYSHNGQPVAAELPHSLPLYRVYNIVAYCFVKAGRYQQALNYIMNSLELHENAENVAYGYIRCVRLYVKEYLILMSLEDEHYEVKNISVLRSRPNKTKQRKLEKIVPLYASVHRVDFPLISILKAITDSSIFSGHASSGVHSKFRVHTNQKIFKKMITLQEKEIPDCGKISRHYDGHFVECIIDKRLEAKHFETDCGNRSRNYDGRFVECIIDKRLEAKPKETGKHNSFEQLVDSKNIPEYIVLLRIKMYIRSRVSLSKELSEKLILGSIKRKDSLLCRLVLSHHEQLNILISSYVHALESSMNNSENDHAKAIAWYITRMFVRSHIYGLGSIRDIWPAFVCICKTNGTIFCSRQICIVIEPTIEHVNFPSVPNMYDSVEIKLLPQKQKGETEAQYIANRVKDMRNISISKKMSVAGEVAENLFKKHSKLTIINNSLCKSIGYQEKQTHEILEGPCIQFYCRVKGLIPIGEEHFPRHICDLQTDVIEGHSFLMCNIRIGDKIGRDGRFGTLGGFVMARGYPAFLTCCHVIADPESLSQVNMSLGDKEPVQITYFPWYAKQDGTYVRDQEKLCGTIREAPAFETDNPKSVSLDAVLVTIKRKCVTIDKNDLVATETDRKISGTELGMKTEFLNDNCIDYNQFCYGNPIPQVKIVANRATAGYFESSVTFNKDKLDGKSIDLKSSTESVMESDEEVTQSFISCIKELLLESDDEMQRDMDKYVEDNFGRDMSSSTKLAISDVIMRVVHQVRANRNLPSDNTQCMINNCIKDAIRQQTTTNNATMFGGTHLQTQFLASTIDKREKLRLSRCMYNQIYITGMPFQSGDSGTCIYVKEPENSGCVGMAISNHPGMGCIATPIMEILRHFKIGFNSS